MDVTVDPHGRIALPAPLNDRFAGQRVAVTWHENTDGSVDVHLSKPAGIFGPSRPVGQIPADALAAALSDVQHGQDAIVSLDPAEALPGAAGRMAGRRGALLVTRTFAAQFHDLPEVAHARAVIDVAHAVAAEPAHPSLDLSVTDYPNVWAVTAGDRQITFTRDSDRTPIWLTISVR